MPKAKKPPHDDSQIEEIDLSLIDTNFLDLPIDLEKPPLTNKNKARKTSDSDEGNSFV
jgi:hypothetical protein